MTKLRELQDKRGFYWLILIGLFALFFVRIIALEQDLTPVGLCYYDSLDEGQYAVPAIQKYNLGVINASSLEPYGSYVPPHLRANLIGHVVIYTGMKLLGDNYFGFRISSVFFGFLNLLFLYLNLKYLLKKHGGESKNFAKWGPIAALALLIVDFSFLHASIAVEPSIVRMLFAQILLFIMVRTSKHGCIRYFLLAFFSMLSIGVVYFSNLFFLLACGLLLLMQWKKEGFKKFILYGICFVAGMVSAALLAEIYYMQVWDSHFHTNFFTAISGFSSSAGYQITGLTNPGGVLKSLVKAIALYFSSNPFLYCLPLLASVCVFVPAIMISIFKNKDETATFLFALPFSFLLQTFFSVDIISRKAITIYPILICLVFYLLLIYKKNCKEVLEKKVPSKLRCVYLLVCAVFMISVVCFRLFIYSNGSALDFSFTDKLLIIGLGVIPLVLLLGIKGQELFSGVSWLKKGKKVCFILCLISLCLSPLMICRYFVFDRSYAERDAMKALGEVADGEYVIGAPVSTFTLYNDIKPISTNYEYGVMLLEENPGLLYFDFDDKSHPGMRGFLDEGVFRGSDISVFPIFEGQRQAQEFGVKRNIALYQAMPKYEISKIYREKRTQLRTALVDLQNFDRALYASLSLEEQVAYTKGRQAKMVEISNEIDALNIYRDRVGDIYDDVFGQIYGNIRGNIYGGINGMVYGDIYGDVYGTIEGNVYGTIYGTVYGEVIGTVSGGITGTKEERG